MTRGRLGQITVMISIMALVAQLGCPATPPDANFVTGTPTTDTTPTTSVASDPPPTDEDPPPTNDDPTPDDPPFVPTPGDSDGDGFSDDFERNAIPGSDPLNPNDTPDNPIDTDGDGCSDFDEITFANFCDNDPNTQAVDSDSRFAFSLTVARHIDQPFTDAQLDTVFASASVLLQTVQTDCPDVATETTFGRNGSIATFDVGETVVTTEADLDALFDLPQDIKIVNLMVGVCGVSSIDNLAVILGCAATAESLVIVEFAEPDVWAHEWGHVQGLNHRDGCARNLMHAIEVDTNAVNDLERNAFLTPTPQAKSLVPTQDLPRVPDETLARITDEPIVDWIDRVMGKTYLAGVPADVIAPQREAAGPYLLAMLDLENAPVRKRNIIRALGFTKNSLAIEPLLDGLFSPTGRLTHEQFAAVAETFLAIGRLSRSDATGQAMQFLMDAADQSYWQAADLQWSYGVDQGPSLSRLLPRLAIMAMGVSGDDAALDHLRSLRRFGSEGPWITQIDEAIARLDISRAPRRQTARPTRQP